MSDCNTERNEENKCKGKHAMIVEIDWRECGGAGANQDRGNWAVSILRSM
jgi:hypothetical protein